LDGACCCAAGAETPTQSPLGIEPTPGSRWAFHWPWALCLIPGSQRLEIGNPSKPRPCIGRKLLRALRRRQAAAANSRTRVHCTRQLLGPRHRNARTSVHCGMEQKGRRGGAPSEGDCKFQKAELVDRERRALVAGNCGDRRHCQAILARTARRYSQRFSLKFFWTPLLHGNKKSWPNFCSAKRSSSTALTVR